MLVGNTDKPRWAHEHRCPRLAVPVHRADKQIRKQRKEFAVLLREVVTVCAAAERVDLLANADTLLDRKLSRMEGGLLKLVEGRRIRAHGLTA